MKKPNLKDMTLREKIGQTYIIREFTYKYTEDYKEYFKKLKNACNDIKNGAVFYGVNNENVSF